MTTDHSELAGVPITGAAPNVNAPLPICHELTGLAPTSAARPENDPPVCHEPDAVAPSSATVAVASAPWACHALAADGPDTACAPAVNVPEGTAQDACAAVPDSWLLAEKPPDALHVLEAAVPLSPAGLAAKVPAVLHDALGMAPDSVPGPLSAPTVIDHVEAADVPESAAEPTLSVPAVFQVSAAAVPDSPTLLSAKTPDVSHDADAEDPDSATALSEREPAPFQEAAADVPLRAIALTPNAPEHCHLDSAAVPLSPAAAENDPAPLHVALADAPDSARDAGASAPLPLHVEAADVPDSALDETVNEPAVDHDAGAGLPESATDATVNAPLSFHVDAPAEPLSASDDGEYAPDVAHVAAGDAPDKACAPARSAYRRIGTPDGPSCVSRPTVRDVARLSVPVAAHAVEGTAPLSPSAPMVSAPATTHEATDDDPDSDVGGRLVSSSARNRPAVSPLTANVGLLVSPVEVLMRCSARAIVADVLLRLRIASAQLVKFVLAVIAVVLLAALPTTRRYKRERDDKPLNADDPNPVEAETWLVIGFVVPVVFESVLPDATLNSHAAMQMSVSLTPQDAVIESDVRMAVVIWAIQHSTSSSFVLF